LSCTNDHAKRNQLYVRIGVQLRCPSACNSTSWSTQEHIWILTRPYVIDVVFRNPCIPRGSFNSFFFRVIRWPPIWPAHFTFRTRPASGMWYILQTYTHAHLDFFEQVFMGNRDLGVFQDSEFDRNTVHAPMELGVRSQLQPAGTLRWPRRLHTAPSLCS
jgi:hypothetical protein